MVEVFINWLEVLSKWTDSGIDVSCDIHIDDILLLPKTGDTST
jgi:hypothetical protein